MEGDGATVFFLFYFCIELYAARKRTNNMFSGLLFGMVMDGGI